LVIGALAFLSKKGETIMRSRFKFLFSLIGCLFLSTPISANPVVLDYVPSYNWYHGCSPTASASIIGYWDLHGYENLFDASGWEEVRYTENVQEHISSTAHNLKYDPIPDDPNLPTPPDTSLADFMHTSEWGLNMGWTYLSSIDSALRDYPSFMGYTFTSQYFQASWDYYTVEIDAGNPVLLNVDAIGNDSSVDHSMAGIGYEDRGEDGLWYASYNTWHESETIDWYQFRPRSIGYSFGLDSMAYVHPIDEPIGGLPISFIDFSEPGPGPEPGPAPVPEPSTIVLMGLGLVGLAGYGRKKFRR
jgi:hypothetical protein